MAEEDLAAQIAAGLQESPVYVGESAASWVDADQLASIAETIESAGVPVFIVLQPPPGEGYRAGNDLLTRVHSATDQEGLYIGVGRTSPRDVEPNDPYTDQLEVRVVAQEWVVPGEPGPLDGAADDIEMFLSYGADPETGAPFALGDGLEEVVDLLAAGDVRTLDQQGYAGLSARNDANRAEHEAGREAAREDGALAVALGIGGAVVAAVVLAAVAARWRRSRAAGRGAPRPRRTFALPDAVLTRVREAEAAELRRRARTALLALGERIESTDLRAGDATDAWQAALDHYEAAGRLVPDDDSTPGVLDAVGAIVLVDRGEQALAAARSRRRTWSWTTPCFLNPLHEKGQRGQPLSHGDLRVDAPVCSACRRDLKAGRRPDILDVTVDGAAEHYFETDAEPWASTGFGALDDDLLTRLRTRARRGDR